MQLMDLLDVCSSPSRTLSTISRQAWRASEVGASAESEIRGLFKKSELQRAEVRNKRRSQTTEVRASEIRSRSGRGQKSGARSQKSEPRRSKARDRSLDNKQRSEIGASEVRASEGREWGYSVSIPASFQLTGICLPTARNHRHSTNHNPWQS